MTKKLDHVMAPLPKARHQRFENRALKPETGNAKGFASGGSTKSSANGRCIGRG